MSKRKTRKQKKLTSKKINEKVLFGAQVKPAAEKTIYQYNPKLIKKDLIRTLVVSLVFFFLLGSLYFFQQEIFGFWITGINLIKGMM